MKVYTVKGHDIKEKVVKTGYDRKAVQYANHIIDELKKIGIPRDDIRIETNILGNKNIPAVMECWCDGYYLRFSYAQTKRFVDNLYIIREVIRKEIDLIIKGEKDIIEFLESFKETGDKKEISKEIASARVTLGLDEGEDDEQVINLSYKKLARKHHPDLGGSMDEFQEINNAHKLLKKELGFK